MIVSSPSPDFLTSPEIENFLGDIFPRTKSFPLSEFKGSLFLRREWKNGFPPPSLEEACWRDMRLTPSQGLKVTSILAKPFAKTPPPGEDMAFLSGSLGHLDRDLREGRSSPPGASPLSREKFPSAILGCCP